MPIRRTFLPLVLACFLISQTVAQPKALHQRLLDAQFRFDLSLAEELLPEFERIANEDSTGDHGLDFATVSLLVAELRRGNYEHQTLDKKAKRKLGKDIDKVASTALATLEAGVESSERYRLEADLLVTMIRSKFKGMKYQPRVEKAIAKALALDDSNANAWVSKSRRPLFAPAKHGGDPKLALLYLNRALENNPQHVQALLFRGVTHTRLGNAILARADWDHAIQINPNTEGAAERLLELKNPFEEKAVR